MTSPAQWSNDISTARGRDPRQESRADGGGRGQRWGRQKACHTTAPLTVKFCDHVIDDTLFRVRVLDGRVVVSHEVALKTDGIVHGNTSLGTVKISP